MNTVHFCVAAALPLLAAGFSPVAVAGDPSRASKASQLSGDGSIMLAKGSLTGIVGSAEFIVTSVEVVGEGLYVVLRGAARGAEVALRVPKAMIGGVSLAVGQSITLVAKGAGWVIESAGKVLGFIPNEAGRALLHTERVPQEGT